MQIQIFGAARTVTGSQILIKANGSRLLLECGLYQGRRADTYTVNRNFKYDPRRLDAAILSHAHIDHSGNLPNLVKSGYEGPIYATPATADLASVMLLDSGHIQEADAEFINKKRARRGEPFIEPLYTQADAAEVAGHFQSMDYGKTFEPVPGIKATLLDAGHILGSASISLEINESGQPLRRLWFSGDIGRRNLPILRDPVLPDHPGTLIMESTYGDKNHRSPQESYDEFERVVRRTIERRGKVIIPAFAVGRTQEIVYVLHTLVDAGRLPAVPVYVDSPLAVQTTRVFAKHPECFDQETLEFIRQHRHPALDFDSLHYVTSVDESKSLNERTDPMIIISASGMAETGRILHHLKNNIEERRNTVMIVSWQAPDTLGRRLAERQPVVKIFGEEYRLNAEVATINGLSAHAGQEGLVAYAKAAAQGNKLERILLVHGEPLPAEDLRQCLIQDVPGIPVLYPQAGEVLDI